MYLVEFGFKKCRILSLNDKIDFSIRQTAAPPIRNNDELEAYSMLATTDSKYIYITGGMYGPSDFEPVAKCHRYEIASDLWQDVPDMHHPR